MPTEEPLAAESRKRSRHRLLGRSFADPEHWVWAVVAGALFLAAFALMLSVTA